MRLESAERVRSIVDLVKQRTGLMFFDLRSIVYYLCDCYNGPVGSSPLVEFDVDEDFKAVNALKEMLNVANKKTGMNHFDVTSAIQTLLSGYSPGTPLYSFGTTSDWHVQYATGYSDAQRAVSYFDRLRAPHFSCGDLTWAATMVNASQYTSEWKGGLEDYKDIKGASRIYAIGGNHETYVATYDASKGTWSSAGSNLDVDLWKSMTGCEPFYTVSNKPNDSENHNIYDERIIGTDIFIMLSIKNANAPNLWLDGEVEWLKATLEENKSNRCYVYFHEHDNEDLTADPFQVYPHGISEGTAQGKEFINLMRSYPNVIWFHGHTHTTFEEDHPSAANMLARGYRSVNIPSLQGPRKYNEKTGEFEGLGLKSEGYLVDVYEHCIVLNALDFTTVNQDGTGEATVMERYVL